MTDKELRRLSRRELLQLLLTQGRETEELRQLSEEKEGQLEELNRNYERLKKRLDQKDEQIRQLKGTLEEERTNRRIELEKAGSIAEAALRLNGVFDTAQKAAEHYLYNIRLLYDRKMAEVGETEEAPVPLSSRTEKDPGTSLQKEVPEKEQGHPEGLANAKDPGAGLPERNDKEKESREPEEKPRELPEKDSETEKDPPSTAENSPVTTEHFPETEEDFPTTEKDLSSMTEESFLSSKDTKYNEIAKEPPQNQETIPGETSEKHRGFWFGKKKKAGAGET